jgi:hypothetical protein
LYIVGTGNNKYGQLGLPFPRVEGFEVIPIVDTTTTTTTAMSMKRKVCRLAACGHNHSLVLCCDEIDDCTNNVTFQNNNQNNPINNNNNNDVSMDNGDVDMMSNKHINRSIYSKKGSNDNNNNNSVYYTNNKVFGFGANNFGQVDGSSSLSLFRSPVELNLNLNTFSGQLSSEHASSNGSSTEVVQPRKNNINAVNVAAINCHSEVVAETSTSIYVPVYIAAGGDQSFAIVVKSEIKKSFAIVVKSEIKNNS